MMLSVSEEFLGFSSIFEPQKKADTQSKVPLYLGSRVLWDQ